MLALLSLTSPLGERSAAAAEGGFAKRKTGAMRPGRRVRGLWTHARCTR